MLQSQLSQIKTEFKLSIDEQWQEAPLRFKMEPQTHIQMILSYWLALEPKRHFSLSD